MSHGSMKFTKTFVTVAAIALISACADNTAPVGKTLPFKAPAGFDEIVGVETFTVYNDQGITQRVGDHIIRIPAGAICDPETSSYGPTEWNNPCDPLNGSIVITATMMRDNENHPYVDFQPALRFDPTMSVMLFMRNGRSSQPTELTLKYCNNLGECVDESVEDPALAPFRVGTSSYLGRRVKHFSGYAVNAGEECIGTLTEELDGSWMCYDEVRNERRSGYMVASGKDGKETVVEDPAGTDVPKKEDK